MRTLFLFKTNQTPGMVSRAGLRRQFLVPAIQSYKTFSLYPTSTTVISDKPVLKFLASSTETAIIRGRTISGRIVGVRALTMSVSSVQGGDDGRFQLSESTSLVIRKGDITKWFVDRSSDAIVNPANERMLGGGGADGAIHRAAGPELLEACLKFPEVRPEVRCPTGEARITAGFKLPASHVIHTVGPVYDIDKNREVNLQNAFKNSLKVAKDSNIQYIAFPAISCGIYGYPYDEAATIAISTVKKFAKDIKEVHFVLFADEIYSAWLDKAKELLQA